MKRVVIREPGALLLEEFELAGLVPAGHARLEPILIGICGSDLHVYSGHHPFVAYPVHPGHEVIARVVALGPGVDPAWLDSRVALEPSLVCGECPACGRGDYNVCEELQVMGFQAPGGMATYFDAPTDRLHAVPDALTDEAAALVEPLAVAVRAVRLAGSSLRDVAVIGGGTIGLLCAQVASHSGARVSVIDTDEHRRGAASALGFATPAATGARTFDTVFECVGVEAALRSAISAVRKGGTVMVVGVHGSDARVQAGLIQDFELTLRGSLMYTSRDFEEAFKLLEAGAIDVDAMITARYPLSAAAEAFGAAAGGGRHLKVLLTGHP